jgi:hypothetical protein
VQRPAGNGRLLGIAVAGGHEDDGESRRGEEQKDGCYHKPGRRQYRCRYP